MNSYDLFLHPVFLLVLILAAARITHLITTDTIFDYPRLWISRWDWSREWVMCPWCVGMYVAAAVAALLPPFWHVTAIRIAAVALAANYVTAVIETVTARGD